MISKQTQNTYIADPLRDGNHVRVGENCPYNNNILLTKVYASLSIRYLETSDSEDFNLYVNIKFRRIFDEIKIVISKASITLVNKSFSRFWCNYRPVMLIKHEFFFP